MAFSAQERASIEAQVILKGAVELTAAQVQANGIDPNEVDGILMDNGLALASLLGSVKGTLGAVQVNAGDAPPVATQESDAVEKLQVAFPDATLEPAAPAKSSRWLDDTEYPLVHKLWLVEKAQGIAYGSKDSMFMDNQAIRKLYEKGHREFPADYFVEQMRGQAIPTTQKGKCALGDFKIKRGLSVDAEGNSVVGSGEGNHPLAGKSGYFFGMQKHTPFNWGERPEPIDPNGWLVGVA